MNTSQQNKKIARIADDKFLNFRHVVEIFPNPILITNADGEIMYTNPSWEKLTGYTYQEVAGKNPNILKSEKTPKQLYRRMWKTLLAGKPFCSEDMVNVRKDGKEYQIDTIIFPVKVDEKVYFYVQIEEDITNRKKLEDLKKQFLQTATHELKTPVSALKLLIGLQLRKLSKKDSMQDIVSTLQLVDRELTRLTRLIRELSDVSRIESERLSMDIQIVDITHLIHDVVKQMQPFSTKHKIQFSYTDTVCVYADPDRIKQVLINLINNSLKYSPSGGIVEISLTLDTQNATISINDQGTGIKKTHLSRIFDKYYQVEKKSQSGFGLGLFITRQIIQEHKGKIWVTSQLNKGSTFHFTLKLYRDKNHCNEVTS